MLQIIDTSADEAQAILQTANFGHLALSKDDQPFVLPINFAYDTEKQIIYFLTTEGMKTRLLTTNPKICLQVERVDDPAHWKSVVVTGKAEMLVKQQDVDHAIKLLEDHNRTLAPAINKTFIAGAKRTSKFVVYRIRPKKITGRKTVDE